MPQFCSINQHIRNNAAIDHCFYCCKSAVYQYSPIEQLAFFIAKQFNRLPRVVGADGTGSATLMIRIQGEQAIAEFKIMRCRTSVTAMPPLPFWKDRQKYSRLKEQQCGYIMIHGEASNCRI